MIVYRADWSTNCERIALALGAKGIEVESVVIEYTDRSPVEAVSGQGLVPAIDDGGTVVNDSVAILRHLEQRTPDPPLFPADPAERAAVDVFIAWFERVYKVAPNRLEDELEGDAPDAAAVAEASRELAAHVGVLERLLSGREYLLGGFGVADCVAYPFLKYAAGREPGDDELFHRILEEHQQLADAPRLAAWIARVAERPRAF